MSWIEGEPPYDQHSKYHSSRNVWVMLSDQGGYPIVKMAYITGKVGDDALFAIEHKAYMDWFRAAVASGNNQVLRDKIGIPKYTKLTPWINIPELNVNEKLKDVWNIDRYMEIKKPEAKLPNISMYRLDLNK